jgi:uncharacterized protein (TIGR02453 family)
MSEAAPAGPYFTSRTFAFLRGVARHNNRPWFEKNKPRYEAEVRDPALRFVREMGPKLAKFSRHLVADARPVGGSVSRIYRDLRFSKDKSPYKTNLGIHFFHEDVDRRGESLPGFYLHVEPGECMVASGVWHPAPPSLRRIRDAIAAGGAPWRHLRASRLALSGESLKRVPPGYDTESPFAVDLRRKDFIASIPLKDAELASVGFGSRFLRICAELEPLNRFVASATGTPW